MLTISVSLEKVEENHLVDGWLHLEDLAGQVLHIVLLTICVSLEKVEEHHLVDGWLQLEVLAGQVLGYGLQLLQLGKPAPTTSVMQGIAIFFIQYFYWATQFGYRTCFRQKKIRKTAELILKSKNCEKNKLNLTSLTS